MKLNLLFFCSDYKVGLTQALAEQIIEINKEVGVSVRGVSSNKEMEHGLHDNIKRSGIAMDIIPDLDEHCDFISKVSKLESILQDHNITHINVHNNWQLALVTFIKYRNFIPKNFKIIYTIHGYRHNNPIKSMIAILIIGLSLLLFADRVISMSSYVSKRFWFVKFKTSLVFYMMNKPEFVNAKYNVYGKPLNMAFPAQFRYGKQQDLLINAVDRYIKETNDNSIKLYLPGDGPLLDFMKDKAESLGLSDNIFFPGKLQHKDVINLYEQCNIALVSSNVETYGRCIAEPFVLGKCVITQKTGVAMDVIEDNATGIFFKTVSDLVKILKDLNNHPEKVVSISNEAIQNKSIFSRDNIMKSYIHALIKA